MVVGRLGIKVISFGFAIFIVRWLGDEGYGQYALVWSYVMVFSMLSDAGLTMYTIREIAQKKPDSQYIASNTIVLRLLLALVTIALIMLVSWLRGYSAPFMLYIFMASTILLLYAVQDPFDGVLQAEEKFGVAAAAILLGQLAFVAFGMLLLVLGWHITGLIIASLLNILLAAYVAWYLMGTARDKLQIRLTPRLWPTFIRDSFSFGLNKLLLSWSLKLDVIIISWFWLDQMVGWYSAAYAIILGIVVISNSINMAVYPLLSRYYSQYPHRVSEIYGLVLKYVMIISLPIAGGVYLTADRWVDLLYGSEFAPAGTILAMLVWVVPLTFLTEFFRHALLATDREKIAVYILAIGVSFSIGFNLWLVPIYGFVGAAIVAVAVEVLMVLLYIRVLRAEWWALDGVDIVLKPMAATAIMMLAIWQFNISLLGQLIVGNLTYFGAIWLLGMVKQAEYKTFLSLIQQTRQGLNTLTHRTVVKPQPTEAQADVTSTPFVSVFIPAYNAGPYLKQTIESVLQQTYQNFELIIINDGSTDDTPNIVDQYRHHPKVTVHHNPCNMGMAPTWNIGIQLSRGEFIAKLDADDFYEPVFLETVMNFYAQYPTVGLVFTGLSLVYPDGRCEPEVRYLRSWVRERAAFLEKLLRLCMIRSPTVCVRRECYDNLGGFTDAMKLHADWEMWVRIAANYPVGYIAQRLSNYRMSYGTNVTAQATVDGRSMFDIRLWLELLADGQLPYELTHNERQSFQWGLYEMEMHFAAMAAYNNQPTMQETYTRFAEKMLPYKLHGAEAEQMRHTYTHLHTGLHAFRAMEFKKARYYFLQAIRMGPRYCKPPWIWSKLLLTYLHKTKWGILYR